MAFGFQLAVVRVGSAISLQILGPIYEAFLPDECTYVPTTTMEPDAATVPNAVSILPPMFISCVNSLHG